MKTLQFSFVLFCVVTMAQGQRVYLSLGSANITTNNTEILITDIGEDVLDGLPSLTCNTDLTACCRNSDTGGQGGLGEWYYPDGSAVPNQAAGENFYRVRNAPQVVRLARTASFIGNPLTPTGTYCCMIPTTGGEMTFCANIVACLSLPPLINGMISYSDSALGMGSVATHSCDTGYTLNGGSTTRSCQSDGTWSGLVPTCQVAALFGRCFSAVGCNTDDEVPASSAEDCCVSTNGLYYDDSEGICNQCITFGWTVRTLEGQESALAYSVDAGYFKGTGTRTISANIELVSVSDPMALQASSADFESVLFTNQVVMREGDPSRVFITLSVDNVAQEGTETGILRLVLTPETTQPDNTFFISDLIVIIEDTSTAMIGFNTIEYVGNEDVRTQLCQTGETVLPVTVRKISAIANPVSVRVQPLTIEQALALNLDIPMIENVDITAINPHVPIRARTEPVAVRDFSPEAINITFPADELELDRTEQITVNIELFNDEIDEADREYLVLYLTVLNATSPNLLIDTAVSVGGIDDDDDIIIGFEMMDYSFNEPASGEAGAGETIYLAKQGVTELTYILLLQHIESTNGLEIDKDYIIGINRVSGNQILFPAGQQRLQLFPNQLDFTLIADGVPERQETFGLSSAPESTPTYLQPRLGDSVFPTAVITVNDNDNITVGWEQTTYTVPEGAGVIEACYRIFSPSPTESLRDHSLVLLVDTQPGASNESDSVSLPSRDFGELTNETRRDCIEFTIFLDMDDIYKNSEEFCVDLHFDVDNLFQTFGGLVFDSLRFLVDPSVTCITIEDNTEITIGFIGAPYQAREDMGPVVFTVGVIGSTVLDGDVVVSFSTVDGSTPNRNAVSGSDYVGRSNVTIILNALLTSVEIPVTLIDDNVEGDGNFSAILTLISGERVTVSPDTAVAIIEGNEVVCVELELLVNGRIEYFPDTTAPYLVGTKATHICNLGFSRIGNMIRVCQNDTNFNGVAPTCEPIDIGFKVPFMTVREVDGQFRMCVKLMSEVAADVTITMATENGTAHQGEDFNTSSIPSELVIIAGSTKQCFIGVIINDGVPGEGMENFTISITSVTPNVVTIFRKTTVVIIIDTDVAWIVAQDHIVLETDIVVDLGFHITRGDRSIRTRAFAYTEGGSAIPNIDYMPTGVKPGEGDSNLRWNKSSSLPDTAFTVTIINNPEPEPVKTIQVRVECEEQENCYSQEMVYIISIIDPQGQCSTFTEPKNGQISYDFPSFPMRPYGTSATYTCDYGYQLSISSENATRVCINGIWSGNASTCELVDCGPLDPPTNGRVSLNETVFESTANYSCVSGFGLIGNATRVCQENGIWSDPPLCKVDCGPLSDPDNGHVSVTGTLLESVATYTCNDGYGLVSDSTRVCLPEGNWSGSATCQIDCGPLSDPDNGSVSVTGTLLESIATYTCNDGYGLVGNSTRVCLPEGNWSGSAICQVDCGPLSDPDNGHVSVTGTLFESIATYTCNDSYSIAGELNTTRVCQNDGNWSGSTAICGANCEALTNPDNGEVTQPDPEIPPRSTATYTCNRGYKINDNSTRVCQNNGTWSGEPPVCSQNTCEDLSDPTNGRVSEHGTTPGSFAIYTCNTGYTIAGNSNTRTCLTDGIWSESPMCTQVNCVGLQLSNGHITLSNGTMFESVASYNCNPLYSIVGNSSERVCQADGTWSNDELRCVLNDVEIGIVIAVVLIFLLLLILIVVVLCARYYLRRVNQRPTLEEDSSFFVKAINFRRKSQKQSTGFFEYGTQGIIEQIPESLRIPRSHLKMSATTIGQGQFGIVYKGLLMNWKNVPLQGVAVKALKGLFSLGDVESMVNEIIKMHEFTHPHILSLIGVCLDAGPGISMVMPYMANGNLLDYLKKERSNLEIQDDSPDKALTVRRLLLRICHQIALGMEYLTKQKFIHRDLAARNCMLDSNGNIKVGDFGLAEDVYNCGYFREDKENVRLPYKWMALESLCDSIFSEKTDVWSYGVTMWEVFSGGRNPYPGVDPLSLTQLLQDEKRLDPPKTIACSSEISAVMGRCWYKDPEERPHFTELCSIMDHLLTQISDYVELSMTLVEDQLDIHEYDVVAEEEPLFTRETSI